MERVVAVKPLEAFVLEIAFSTGELRRFDLTPFLDKGVFRTLRDESLFRQAFAGGIRHGVLAGESRRGAGDALRPIDTGHRGCSRGSALAAAKPETPGLSCGWPARDLRAGSAFQPAGDLGDQSPREHELLHPRQRVKAGIVDQRRLVVGAAERILRPVGDDERQLLPPSFLGGVVVDVVRLGSEAHAVGCVGARRRSRGCRRWA